MRRVALYAHAANWADFTPPCNAAAGIIRLDGAADGAQLRIENDMLDAELRPESGHYATVGDHLSVVGDDVWDSPSMFTALKAWLAHSTRIRSGLHHASGFRRMSNFTLRIFAKCLWRGGFAMVHLLPRNRECLRSYDQKTSVTGSRRSIRHDFV